MKEIDHALKPNFTDCATSNYFIIFSPVKAAVVSEALTQWQSDGAFFRQQCMVILKRCKLSWVEGEYRGNSNTTENQKTGMVEVDLTSLVIAAKCGHFKMLKFLLAKGAKVFLRMERSRDCFITS
jgi:hypothetical protein